MPARVFPIFTGRTGFIRLYSKSFTDQARSVKMAEYWLQFVHQPRLYSRSIKTQERTWPTSSYLDITLVNSETCRPDEGRKKMTELWQG